MAIKNYDIQNGIVFRNQLDPTDISRLETANPAPQALKMVRDMWIL